MPLLKRSSKNLIFFWSPIKEPHWNLWRSSFLSSILLTSGWGRSLFSASPVGSWEREGAALEGPARGESGGHRAREDDAVDWPALSAAGLEAIWAVEEDGEGERAWTPVLHFQSYQESHCPCSHSSDNLSLCQQRRPSWIQWQSCLYAKLEVSSFSWASPSLWYLKMLESQLCFCSKHYHKN